MEENSEATRGPGWSTETADYLDKLWARHEAEKAEADEKLQLKEERKALRKRKLEERSANDATSASCGKGQTSTVLRELRSCTIPESTLLVEATPDAIDDVHSSKRRRSDAVTPTDASEPHIDSDSVHPPTLLVEKHRPPELEARLQSQIGLGGPNADCSAHSASAATLASASKRIVVPIPTCSNCGAPTGSHVHPSALTPGWGICEACKKYERRNKKHRPPELEAARQSRVAVNLGGAKPLCVNCCTTIASLCPGDCVTLAIYTSTSTKHLGPVLCLSKLSKKTNAACGSKRGGGK